MGSAGLHTQLETQLRQTHTQYNSNTHTLHTLINMPFDYTLKAEQADNNSPTAGRHHTLWRPAQGSGSLSGRGWRVCRDDQGLPRMYGGSSSKGVVEATGCSRV